MFRKDILNRKDLINFLKTVDSNDFQEVNQVKNIGILVTPWLGTPVPWYSLIIGVLLRYKGHGVTFFINDMWISNEYSIPYGKYIQQCKEIIKVINKNQIIKKNFDLIYLGKEKKSLLTIEDEEKIKELAQIATIRQFESSGDADTEKYKESTIKWKKIFDEFYPNIISALSKENWEKIIIPGGLFLDSGLFFEAAKKRNIKVVTYDSSPTSVFIGINTCAARNGNVKEAVDTLVERGEGGKIYKKAINILEMRRSGKADIAPHMNSEVIQKCVYNKPQSKNDYDVVVFMNVEYDTAALGTHNVFENDLEWIDETVKYIIENTDLKIAIREHPLQRLFGKNSLCSKIQKIAENDRTCFFQYDANVNSYSLIEAAKCIVVCTSTIGLEAAMLDKPVILESDCYYSDVRCVKQARTKEQYFQYISDSISNPVQMTRADKERISIYYYLTQMYGSIRNGFSPQPDSFARGIKNTFNQLRMRRDVNIQIECIEEEKPLCLMLYEADQNLE